MSNTTNTNTYPTRPTKNGLPMLVNSRELTVILKDYKKDVSDMIDLYSCVGKTTYSADDIRKIYGRVFDEIIGWLSDYESYEEARQTHTPEFQAMWDAYIEAEEKEERDKEEDYDDEDEDNKKDPSLADTMSNMLKLADDMCKDAEQWITFLRKCRH